MKVSVSVWRGVGLLILGLAQSFLGGCDSSGYEERNTFETKVKAGESALDILKQQGGKFQPKMYPLGAAWEVDLRGVAQINDETFVLLKKVGPIAEMHLNGSSLTDAHMVKLGDPELSGVFVKLDLGNTAVSDVGLGELKTQNFLQELNLAGTKVTPAGIAAFRKMRQENNSILPIYRNVKIRY
ncbi:MAG: hypothetical protein ACT4QC_22750 [Planctomycetaceae bacterium]